MNKNIFKSIWAVLAGFLVIVILSVGTDSILALEKDAQDRVFKDPGTGPGERPAGQGQHRRRG